MDTTKLDMSGLLCPLPVLKTQKALRSVESGMVLEVTTTDPGAVADFQCLAEQDGLELLEQVQNGDVCVHVLKKVSS
ncbi:MAG: response regulator SirA [Methyloligella sp.]|jgi:tRNA 2-thiouridine synthesizing protein A|nr:MAG: response regulator SirA [Methyloligella sp.]